MKLGLKILLIICVFFLLIFSSFYLTLFFQGKNLVISQLENFTGRKVSLGYFEIRPPFNLAIKNLVIQDLAEIDFLSISPSLIKILAGKIALNKVRVIKPKFYVERKGPPSTDQADNNVSEESTTLEVSTNSTVSTIPAVSETAKQGAVLPQKKSHLALIIKSLKIRDGQLIFNDYSVGQEGIKIVIKEINMFLDNLYLPPRSAITNFELKGKLPWQQGEKEGSIEVEGWFNFAKRNAEASLRIKDIDGIYLCPYYSTWVNLQEARIEKATLNFSSDIHGLNNNITADCHLELSDIVRKAREEGESEEKAEKITDAVLDIFKAMNQGKIVLDFTIRTKIDRPEFGFGSIKDAFEEKLALGKKANGFKVAEVLGAPAKIVEGTFSAATDLTTAVISGTINAGKKIGKTVKDSFKKEEKKKEENKD